MRRSLLLALVAPLALAAYACGGSTSTGGSGADGGPGGGDASAIDGSSNMDGGGSSDGGTTDLFPADTQKIVVSSKGGFGPGLIDGSTCAPSDTTYTLTLPARELTWKVCSAVEGGPTYAFDTGTKTLSAADTAPLEAALHAIAVTTTTMCGADAPTETVTFTTPSGDKVLYDDFYYCMDDGKTYVHGIGAVLAEFAKLAH